MLTCSTDAHYVLGMGVSKFLNRTTQLLTLATLSLTANSAWAFGPVGLERMSSSEQTFSLDVPNWTQLNQAYTNLVHSHLLRNATNNTVLTSDLRRDYTYDSVLLSTAAGIDSARYFTGTWEHRALNFSREDRYGNNFEIPVVGHIQYNGSTRRLADNRLYIVLNSSFSNWSSDMWFPRIVSTVRDIDSHASFIGFSGFLSTDFLSFKYRTLDITGEFVARDLYRRIRQEIAEKLSTGYFKEENIGLLGFSGGGLIATALLAEDARYADEHQTKLLFGKGAFAFSPILHSSTALNILDTGEDQNILDGTFSYGPFFGRQGLLFLLAKYHGIPDISSFLRLTANDRSDLAELGMFRSMFYNEFIQSDLKSLVASVKNKNLDWEPSITTHGERAPNQIGRYTHFFKDFLFSEHRRKGLAGKEQSYDDYTNYLAISRQSRAPLYVVFANDDAVLGRPNSVNDRPLSEGVLKVLDGLRQQENVRVFNPNYGGHLGYFLDDIWLRNSLKDFFYAAPAAFIVQAPANDESTF